MERDKALQMALGQIEKQFGKGAVMRMGDQSSVKVAVIPTGALALDLALGVGGLPRGRVVEIYGPESSGKCVPADTRVWTDRGLETVAELFARCGLEVTCTSRITDVSEFGVRVVNECGELEQVAALTHNNRKPVLRLRLESGRTLTVTHNHPLRVRNESGCIVWRSAEEIVPGDVMVSAAFGAVEAAEGDGLSEDEAVLLGYVVAERCDGEDDAVHSAALRAELIDRYGLDCAAQEKSVPHCVRTGGHKAQRAFLSALFEADGWIDESSLIRLETASAALASDVQLMLYGLGIPATISSRSNQADQSDRRTVALDPAVAHWFLEEIGLRSVSRRRQLEGKTRRSSRDPQVASSPHLSKLPALGHNRYAFERVEAIEDAGEQPTFDLVLPRTHSFLANGVLSHNTTVALHAIAEAQKAGGIAAFVDAEHALDPSYAAALGVDMEALLVSQPDTGEQALEITDMLVRSGAVDIVVIDSVAALTPRAELEGEMGDTHVGLQARLMSQALRKLAGTLNRSRTCCVFINQLREKVGVMFGSPEVTPGGRALKFYSSVRLDVRRIESLKDGTDFVGNRVRVKVVKNKCIAEGTRVFDPLTGAMHTIEELVYQDKGTAVWAVDKRGEFHIREIGARLDQGQRDVLGLKLRDGTVLRVTPDHRILTELGWRVAGELRAGDRVARPRHVGGFGAHEPVPPAHARLIGYLIGRGHMGGKAPVSLLTMEESLQEDVRRIASELGCNTDREADGTGVSFWHRSGESNGVLALAQWAGIWGRPTHEQRIPQAFFDPQTSADVVGNLLIGMWETDGWFSRPRTGRIRCGFATASEQLAWQVHFLLLRWGIRSSAQVHKPGSKRSSITGCRGESMLPCWQVQIHDIDNVRRFFNALPMWGPKGQGLASELENLRHAKLRGSSTIHLSSVQTEPVLQHLRQLGVSSGFIANVLRLPPSYNRTGLKLMLGGQRLRRDRVELLADALDSAFLREVLADGLFYDRIEAILPVQRRRVFDIEVLELHNFVAEDVVVHNCAPPFQQCEFDILFGQGISREGSLLDVGVEHGIIKKAGAWYTYEGDQLGQGRENARRFLKEHDDVAAEIYKKVTENLGLVPTDVTGEE